MTEHVYHIYVPMLVLVHLITALGFGDVQVHQEPRVCKERSQDPVQGGQNERNWSGYPGEASPTFYLFSLSGGFPCSIL